MKARTRFFQFSVVSIIAVTLFSGLYLWLNICFSRVDLAPGDLPGLDTTHTCKSIGWPIPFYAYYDYLWMPLGNWGLLIDVICFIILALIVRALVEFFVAFYPRKIDTWEKNRKNGIR